MENGKKKDNREEELHMEQLTERQKAEVLIEALPYIQRFNRKIIVVKYGGSAMVVVLPIMISSNTEPRFCFAIRKSFSFPSPIR